MEKGKLKPAILKFSVPDVQVLMRAYFSSYHLWAARHFAQLSHDIEDQHSGDPKFDIRHRSYVTNSILSSVAFLEAAINELFQDAFDNHLGYLESLDKKVVASFANFWRFSGEQDKQSPYSFLEKYQLALTIAHLEPFDKSLTPYQNVDLIRKLRNALIHYKPKTTGIDEEHPITDKLRNKFAPNKLMEQSGNPFFPDKCLGYGCAKWAVDSALQFTNEFFNRLNMKPKLSESGFRSQD